MATYRGVNYEAGVGPTGKDVVLFAACPPPEELGFQPGTGHWRKALSRAEVDAVWESRPSGSFGGEPCLVLDDLDEHLHISYLGRDPAQAERLGYTQMEPGVFELLAAREDVTGITEDRLDHPFLPWQQGGPEPGGAQAGAGAAGTPEPGAAGPAAAEPLVPRQGPLQARAGPAAGPGGRPFAARADQADLRRAGRPGRDAAGSLRGGRGGRRSNLPGQHRQRVRGVHCRRRRAAGGAVLPRRGSRLLLPVRPAGGRGGARRAPGAA